MINIELKNLEEVLKKLQNDIEKSAETMQEAMVNLANSAKEFWQDEAGKHLHSTLDRYRNAISTHTVDAYTTQIFIHDPDEKVNWLIMSLEYGVPPFDLKKARLAGESAKNWSIYAKRSGLPKANAPFVDIPFRKKGAGLTGKPAYFRRMAPSSKGWEHPGFKGLNLHEKVIEHIQEEASKIFGPILEKITVK